MTIQNRPSETSEMSGSNEHIALLPDYKDTSPIIPWDTIFEESSSLMMKSSSYDNVSNDVICLFIRSIVIIILCIYNIIISL